MKNPHVIHRHKLEAPNTPQVINLAKGAQIIQAAPRLNGLKFAGVQFWERHEDSEAQEARVFVVVNTGVPFPADSTVAACMGPITLLELTMAGTDEWNAMYPQIVEAHAEGDLPPFKVS